MNPLRWLTLLLGLLLTTGCVPHVKQASPAAIQKLRSNPSPRQPSEFPNGQLKTDYPIRVRPGSLIHLPLQASHRIPTVPAFLNHHKLPWIIDTGANFPILLDAQSAASLHLPVIKDVRIKGTGVGGNTDLLLGRFHSLSCDKHDILGRGITGILLQTYHFKFAGVPISRMPLNLLGLPFLELFSFVTIDAPGNEVLLGYKRQFHPTTTAQSFPFQKEDGRLWVTVHVAGHPIRAFLDTGYGSTLRLPACELHRLPKSATQNISTQKRPAMGVGGVVMEDTGQLKEARIGPIRIAPVEYETSEACTEAMLGWGAFHNKRMTIDFVQNRVWID